MNLIAQNVKRIIESRGLKQKAVAEKAGYDKQKFSRMMNDRKIIECSDSLRLCAALEVTPNELFGFNSGKR